MTVRPWLVVFAVFMFLLLALVIQVCTFALAVWGAS